MSDWIEAIMNVGPVGVEVFQEYSQESSKDALIEHEALLFRQTNKNKLAK